MEGHQEFREGQETGRKKNWRGEKNRGIGEKNEREPFFLGRNQREQLERGNERFSFWYCEKKRELRAEEVNLLVFLGS